MRVAISIRRRNKTTTMTVVYESKFYIVKIPKTIIIDRDDGGHIEISPKTRLCDRQALTPKQAIELMRLTSVVGQALPTAMKERGIDIGRVNYQDNGNWDVFSKNGPYLHVHILGRAKNAKVNVYGQALNFPHIKENSEYYKNLKPLNADDILLIKREIDRLLDSDAYKNSAWGL